MIIVFSGLDGSGKSTHALKTKHYLLKKGHSTVYRHVVKSSISESIAKGINKISPKTKKGLEKKLRSNKKRHLLAWGKRITLFFDIILFNLKYHQFKENKKAHIICDRYFYDELIQFKYLSLGLDFLFNIYNEIILKPDIIFYLEVTPQTAFRRKPEYKFSYYTHKSKLYTKIKSLKSTITIKSSGISPTQKKIESALKNKLNQ